MDTSFVAREQTRMLGELSGFLSIPSVSALPAHAADCRRAAEWLREELVSLGCPTVELLEGQGHPVVWAESPRVPDRPTLLIYGHYDVQPPDPLEEWITPAVRAHRSGTAASTRAARPTTRARSSASSRRTRRRSTPNGRPPLNVNFIFEGEEESGGNVIADLLHAEPERTRADAALVCDTSYYAPGWPAVYTALRGLCYAEISVRTLERDLHSGTYGGVAPNALETLVRLLAKLKDADGEIQIPKLYKAVEPPTKHELKTWKQLPFDKAALPAGGSDRAGAHRAQGVFGPRAGVGASHLRDPRHQGRLRGGGREDRDPRAGDGQGEPAAGARARATTRWRSSSSARWRSSRPEWAEVKVTLLHGGDPVRVDVDHPAFAVLDEAFAAVTGRPAVQVRAGGSIPIIPELGLAGAPVLLTGIGLPDDGLHSPNEKLDLAQLWSGIEIFGRFFELFAEKGAVAGRAAAALLFRCHPLDRAGVARLGAGVQLVDADERPHRGDDPRHDVVGPVRIGPLPRGQLRRRSSPDTGWRW